MMAHFFKKHKEADKTDKGDNTGSGTQDKAQAGAVAANLINPAASADGKSKATPLLNDEDEQFLERLISNSDNEDDEGPPPPLPPRPKTPDLTWESDSDSFRSPNAPTPEAPPRPLGEQFLATKKPSRFSRLFQRKPSSTSTTLTVPSATQPPGAESQAETDREWADLNLVLARLDLNVQTPPSSEPATLDPSSSSTSSSSAAKPESKTKTKTKNLALTASAEVQSLLRQFLLILKDIMHGAPHAVDDLVALLDGRNDVLKKGFDKLPSSMQKLVTQLPKKLTAALGPEVLAAAAAEKAAKGGGADDGGKGLTRLLMPGSLGELVMTPAIVKAMLKAIVNALKLRWPAFVGTSMLWSTAVFLLLFVLWYFHKRGREEREKLEAEGAEAGAEGKREGEEVEGDGMVSSAVVVVEPPAESPRS